MSSNKYQAASQRIGNDGPDHDSPVLVIIPAWNEQASVGEVVRQVRFHTNFDVIVVDDASTDQTAAMARQAGAKVLSLPVNLGAWGAIQTGLRFAHKHGYAQAVSMDADGQHLSTSIDPLIAPLRSYQADVAIGSCTPRGSRARKMAWILFRWFSGLSVRDLTSGLRAYSAPAITLLASSRASLLDYQDVGVLLLLRKAGLRIQEVQVNMKPRVHGPSKIFSSWLKVAEYMLLTLILCFSHCFFRSCQRKESA
jgi:glycosyltransferase involved in cell wall biosynthesis